MLVYSAEGKARYTNVPCYNRQTCFWSYVLKICYHIRMPKHRYSHISLTSDMWSISRITEPCLLLHYFINI